MNENKRLLKNTGLIAIGNLGAKVMSFLLLPLYTSILTTTEYGTYDFIVAVCAFLFPVVTLSMNEAMFRFIIEGGDDENNFKQSVSHSFILQLLGIGVLGVVMLVVSRFYSPINCLYIWLYVGANALYSFSTYMLRAVGKTKIYTVISLVKTSLQLGMNVFTIAVLRWGLNGLLFSLCLSEVISFFLVFIPNKLWKHISIKHLSKERMKLMLTYSLPLVPNTLCSQIINLSDRIVISAFMGKASNGVYAVSYKFPNMIETVYHYFYLAWSESASRVVKQGKEAAKEYYQKLHDVLDNLIYSVVLMLIAGMAIMFRVFIRGDYLSGFEYVPVLAFSMYFNCMGKFYSGIYSALKKTKVLAVSTVIGAVLNIAINVAFIHFIGLYAAAISTLVSEIVVVVVRKIKLKKDVDIKMSALNILLKLLMAGAVMVLYSYDEWWKIFLSIAIVGVYALIVNRAVIMQIVEKLMAKIKPKKAE